MYLRMLPRPFSPQPSSLWPSLVFLLGNAIAPAFAEGELILAQLCHVQESVRSGQQRCGFEFGN